MEKNSIEKELLEHGEIIIQGKGFSMSPMLKVNNNLVKIVKHTGRLKKYDVALFKYDGHYVLHRVIKVNEDSYDFSGDSTMRIEKNVKDDQILGVLTEFVHDTNHTKWVSVDNPAYKLFSKAIVFMMPLRRTFLKAYYKKKDNG